MAVITISPFEQRYKECPQGATYQLCVGFLRGYAGFPLLFIYSFRVLHNFPKPVYSMPVKKSARPKMPHSDQASAPFSRPMGFPHVGMKRIPAPIVQSLSSNQESCRDKLVNIQTFERDCAAFSEKFKPLALFGREDTFRKDN